MSASVSRARGITLDDLVALNEEIAALVRAGVPLETGLRGLAGDVSGPLGRISGRLADRIQRGASLEDALAAEVNRLPAAYTAVVTAGLKSGRLPDALHSLSRFSRMLVDLRGRIELALIYPCLVLLAVWYLFWLKLGDVAAMMREMTQFSGREPGFWLEAVETVHSVVARIGHAFPLLLAALVVWWLLATRLTGPESAVAPRFVRWLSGIRAVHSHVQRAVLCELASILIEHDVPLPEALPLAARAAGDRRLVADAGRLAADVQVGKSFEQSLASAKSFPPFMLWMMAAGHRQGRLAASLRHLADMYGRRAERRADWLRFLAPAALVAVIGGGAVFVYAMAYFLPLTEMLQELTLP